ncbi:MAG: hypothetical protein GYB37_09520 [Algicola sp.]|nr:hypothetical protein [Algicola sp.]
MKKLVIKLGVYAFLILISLEVLVRMFYLGEDKPSRFVDESQVEKWRPNQEGYSVTGNRNQNFVRYNINDSGFNSYQEFEPTKDGYEVALVGDSFIEGFHQPYKSSIGRKMELKLGEKIKVFEYGYAGYDMADQMHLIYAYREDFELIDRIYIKMKFSNDLNRGEYYVQNERLNLESPLNKILKKSKLLVYLSEIGALTPVRNMINDTRMLVQGGNTPKPVTRDKAVSKDQVFLENFKNLVALYGYDKNRTVLLMDVSTTPKLFIDYLDTNGFEYIDFGQKLNNADRNTTLVYDRHWNNYGRTLIAELLVHDLKLVGAPD